MRLRGLLAMLLLTTALWPLACARSRTATPPSPPSPPEPTSTTAAPVDPDPLVGAVFLGASDLHTCTGSVLHSATGNLILTAAHCLSSNYPTTFVPGFNGQAGPDASWNVDAIYLDPRWLANQDPLADFAIVRVSRQGGTLESKVGTGLTLGTTPAAGTVVSITGYPLGVGGPPIGCRVGTGMSSRGFPSLQCGGLVAGTSGAPWRTKSTAVGLVGGLDGGGCEENLSYSPPFDGGIVELLHRAEAGGPADTAPEVFDDEC
jgi:Trypsin